MNKGRKYFIEPGQRFGRLTVIDEFSIIDNRGQKERRVACLCDCGTIMNCKINSLFDNTKSCGCLRRENSANLLRIHGLYHDPAFAMFRRMKARCYYKGQPNYKQWGGRGILICDEWLNNPRLFCEWAYENGFDGKLTIERIDNNKGYSPDNCTFTNRLRQANNTRNNHIIEYCFEKMSMADFCRKHDLNYDRFQQRITHMKWPITKAMQNCGNYIPMNNTDKLKAEGKVNYELADAKFESLYHKLS